MGIDDRLFPSFLGKWVPTCNARYPLPGSFFHYTPLHRNYQKDVLNTGGNGDRRGGYDTRRLPAEHSSLRGECPADSSLSHASLSMVRQRAYPRSFGSAVSLVTTGQLTH